jgi:hypothetical protein
MKKTIYFLAFCFLLSVQGFSQSGDEKQINAAVEALKKAMLSGNKAELEALVANELSYGHSNGKMENRAAFIEALASGKSDFTSIDLTEQTVTIAGNTALVRHRLTGEAIDSGKPGAVKLGVLLVWQKQGGKWKLLARQAFKL